jgi:hypothetical protein
LCSKAQTIWFLAQRNGFIFSSSFVFLVNLFSNGYKDRKELAFLDTHLPITMRTFLVIIKNKNKYRRPLFNCPGGKTEGYGAHRRRKKEKKILERENL